MSKTPDYDYSQYTEVPSNEALAKLSELALELKASEVAVAEAEKALEAAKARFKQVSEKDLPEHMASLGLLSFKHSSGLEIVVKDFFNASLPKSEVERYARGLDWLEKSGNAGLLKNTVSAEFGRGKDAEAKAFAETLRAAGHAAKYEKTVNPQTLKAFVRERLEKGETVPEDIFGVFHGKVAKIK